MFIVIEKKAYVRDFLATVTVMTLMTVICGLILDEGMRLYFVGPYPFNLPDEPDAQSKDSLTYAIFEATSGVGFV
jgi:hypothetical protein